MQRWATIFNPGRFKHKHIAISIFGINFGIKAIAFKKCDAFIKSVFIGVYLKPFSDRFNLF